MNSSGTKAYTKSSKSNYRLIFFTGNIMALGRGLEESY